jgi:hypothetical protein
MVCYACYICYSDEHVSPVNLLLQSRICASSHIFAPPDMYLWFQSQMTSSWWNTSCMSVSPVTTCDLGHIQDHKQNHMLTFCAWDCTLSITSLAIIASQPLTSRILYWTWIDGWWDDGGRILLTPDWHCRCLCFNPWHSYHLHPHLNLNVNLGSSNSATISVDYQILHLISVNRDAVLGGNVRPPTPTVNPQTSFYPHDWRIWR